jgi:hypothetical protein
MEKSVVLAWSDSDNVAMGADTAYRISEMVGSVELAAITERLLGLLPSWFGIPDAKAKYVASAGQLPGLVAHADTKHIGILLCKRHFPYAAELLRNSVAALELGVGTGRIALPLPQRGAQRPQPAPHLHAQRPGRARGGHTDQQPALAV